MIVGVFLGILAACISVLGGALVVRLAVLASQNRGTKFGGLIAAVGFLTKLPIAIGVGLVAYRLGPESWAGFVPAFVASFLGLIVAIHVRSLKQAER